MCEKNANFHIFETTAFDCNQILHSDKDHQVQYSSWVVQICSKQIQDGRQPPSWKITITLQQMDRFWQNLTQWFISILQTLPANKILEFLNSKIAAAAILKHQKIVISQKLFDQFW